MAKQGKRIRNLVGSLDLSSAKPLDEAVKLVKACSTAKFDETIEVSVNMGVDPRHADQMVRGTVSLPHGTGKTVRVLVFAKGDKVEEALQAGADFAGADDLAEKILGGWLEFDRVVACPDVMGVVGKLGRVLGPRGLMPNPKLGTVTMDVTRAVRSIKAGEVAFRVEKAGIVHAGVGKASFGEGELADNIRALMEQLRKLRPTGIKGVYIQKVCLSPTMGPSVRVDPASITTAA
ncbi:MAG: 50S ribosomal protein L1 [Magnetococcales bacterium]|nr:50S ribosomal protein L1 [Magnetococcales bacterium]